MKTEDLIRAMAEDPAAGVRPARKLWPLLAGAALLSLAGLAATLGLRGDLGVALTSAPVLRHLLTLALFGLAMAAALRLSRPEGRAALWPFLAVAAVAAAMLAWAVATTPAEGWGMALRGKTQWVCLVSIPLLSILPVAALMLALRQGASTAPALSGALAGLAGGGLGAAIYALHCTEDSPMFWVTWYGVAILIVTVASTLIGRRALRW